MTYKEICPTCNGEGKYFNNNPPEFTWKICSNCFGSGYLNVEDLFIFQEEYDLVDEHKKLWLFKRKGDLVSYYIPIKVE